MASAEELTQMYIEPAVYSRLAQNSLSPTHMRAAVQYVKRRETLVLPEYQAQILDDALVHGVGLPAMEEKYGWSARSAKVVVGVLLTSIFSNIGTPQALANAVPMGVIEEIEEDKISEVMRKYGMTPNGAIVLAYLMSNANKAVRVRTLVNALYGHLADGGPDDADGVVRVCVHRARRALQRHRTNGRIVTIYGYGYVYQTLSDAPQPGDPPPNLIANGGFDADLSGWTDKSTGAGTAEWSPDGTALLTSASSSEAGSVSQSVATVPGETYAVWFDVAANDGTGAVGFYVNGLVAQSSAYGVGTHTVTFTATDTAHVVQWTKTYAGTAKIDNVSVTKT